MKKGTDEMKKTNLDAIRQVAVAFLYTEIHETGIVFVASHPFTDRWETYMLDSEWGDLHDSKTARKWREIIEKQLKKSDLFGIFVMMNRPYILNFLKFVEGYMSDEDLGTILGSFWSNIEQISLDDSVTGKELVKWFQRADKNTLMEEKARKRYEALPETVTVYRGVTSYNEKETKALSWTTDKEIAEWFAKRFATGTGKIWTLEVPKERILCVFDGKEKEIILNLYGFKKKISVEKV